MKIEILIAVTAAAFILGIIFEIVMRALNERGTVYGIMVITLDDNGQYTGEIRLDERYYMEVPNKKRVVLKVRTRNKDFNGN